MGQQQPQEPSLASDYKFNDKGVLIHSKTGKKYTGLNQEEYDKLIDYLLSYIQSTLIEKYNLLPLYVPNISNKENQENFSAYKIRDISQAQCKIFVSNDFDQKEKCLLIIQGSGGVRAGIWSRKVCINEGLSLGSMLPYVEKAINNGLSVIILNPNQREDFENKEKMIQEFNSMESHCLYVYKNIIKPRKNIKEIYIVAHSMGGVCTIDLLDENNDDLMNGRIKKIAFTDTFHGMKYLKLKEDSVKKLKEISRDYIHSKKKVGEFEKSEKDSYNGVNEYSAGDFRHEYTSGCAIEEIFKYFDIKNELNIYGNIFI